MNITRENIDNLNAVLRINVIKSDYEEKVESLLKDYRKKATIKGFRPGMVPIGLVRKIYGRAVQIDEINKIVTDNIQKYIVDEKIEILGDPIPSDDQENIDFDSQEDFNFSFELALAPVIELNLSKNNKVPYYEINIDEKMKNDYIDNYARRYGELRSADSTEGKDVVKGKIEAAGDDGSAVPEGISIENTSLGIDIIKDDNIKSDFLGKRVGETVVFDIKKAYPNDNEIAGILHISKDDVGSVNSNFRFTIYEISRFFPAQIDQELFDKIYGEGVVTSEEEFMKKVEDEISSGLQRESDFKLMLDVKALALEETNFELPEEFLKKWLLKINDKTTKEQISEEFDSFRKDLKWQLIRNKVARDNEVKISEEDLQKEAENITRQQFQQYGLFYATDEQISKYATETLKREEDAKKIADRILENKVTGILTEQVKLENKGVTVDEFNKLFEQQAAN
jgi:trigger factor